MRTTALLKMLNFFFVLMVVVSPVWAASPAGESPPPRYRLTLGKGTSVCEAYLKHLNAFPREEPAMICERKLNPAFSNFRKPDWEEIDVWEHLDWVYEIDYLLKFPNHPGEDYFGYTLEGKKALSFEDWRKDYEARTRAVGIKPRLYRATLPMEFWVLPMPERQAGGPLPPLEAKPRVWLAYDKGFDRCVDYENERVALHGGGLYRIFVLDEAAERVDYQRFLESWPGSVNEVDLFVYRNKTYFNDQLDGGAGNDTYLFGRGDGQDVISSSEWNSGKLDVVMFKAGVTAEDVQLSRRADDLILKITGASDQLRISNYFYNDGGFNPYRIEAIRFADGSATWRYAEQSVNVLSGTDGDDMFYGNGADNYLRGLGGNDTITDPGGNDIGDDEPVDAGDCGRRCAEPVVGYGLHGRQGGE